MGRTKKTTARERPTSGANRRARKEHGAGLALGADDKLLSAPRKCARAAPDLAVAEQPPPLIHSRIRVAVRLIQQAEELRVLVL